MRNCICVLIIICLALSAFAATGNMSLLSPGKLNGTQLGAGNYKLAWTGEGNNVQVSVTGNGVKMSAPASVEHSNLKLADEVVKTSDGTISEIHISGKNLVVKFAGTTAN